MEQFTYVIKDKDGIHARPAGLLVKQAKQYENSKITLTKDGDSADLKKLFALMKLGIKQGEEVTVTIEGGDERQAAAVMLDFLQNNL